MERACYNTRNPASVGITPRVVRKNSDRPISLSIFWISFVSADCVLFSKVAAALMDPVSATATIDFTFDNFMY